MGKVALVGLGKMGVGMASGLVAFVAGFSLLLAGESGATPTSDTSPSSADFFRRATMQDIEAAWRLLRDNHPGAAVELEDRAFQGSLASALSVGRARAGHVTTLEGYLAVMSGFDSGLGDRHVRTVPTINISRPDWVGLIIGLRGMRWLVVDEEPWSGRASLLGASLVGCDGRGADEIANERLGQFRGAQNGAQKGLVAPWLLIDERNPFLMPLRQCTFDTGTKKVTIPMDWTPIMRDVIIARLLKAGGGGAAGYGVRRAGSGWWIAIQEFTGNAPAVVAEAREKEAEFPAAPFVVVDVRGNGGGASAIGDELARVLFGAQAQSLLADEDRCPEAWRVSPGNRARLESYPAMLGARLTAATNLKLQDDVTALRSAAAAGRAFSRPIACPRVAASPSLSAQPAVATTPRIFILTDRVCFSSCLIVVDHFRKLGAIQIGEATNADTHYQENRRELLPSGLAFFGVQEAVSVGEPLRVGPYVPRYEFSGDLTDTHTVEQWVFESMSGWLTAK